MSLLDAQAAELDYTDHPGDGANWPPERRYVAFHADRRTGHQRPNAVAHIVVACLDYLPDAWRSACCRAIRGTATSTPTQRICPRCLRELGDA